MKRANFFSTHFGKRLVKLTTYQIALSAVFMALTMVATLVISVPVPATNGYVNIGDTIIFIGGALFGPFVGGIAGGLGSMFADLILGYAFYAPFTFLVKGLEGVLAGLLGYFIAKKFKKTVLRYAFQFLSFVLSGLLMCLGYFLVEYFAFGVGNAVTALTGNFIQAFVSVALASALLFFCKLGERVVKKGIRDIKKAKRPEFSEKSESQSSDAQEPTEVTEFIEETEPESDESSRISESDNGDPKQF